MTASALLTGVSIAVPIASLPTPAEASPANPSPPACYNPVSTWPIASRLNQLLMVSGQFADLGSSSPEARAGVGGLVLFGQPPAGSAPSIRSGLDGLQAVAASAGQMPIWMSTDEEGGNVSRLADVIGPLPTPRQMASSWTPAQTEAAMAIHGSAMRALGISMDLAPVLDTSPAGNPVADEGDRSFSDDPAVVEAYGSAFSWGLEQAGVVPVVKHFPGLGHASADTDLGPATVPPLSQLETHDLIPFQQSVAAGAPVVMVGNMSVPGLTGSTPASLSAAAYQFLRQHLHFAGVTITDALDAGAVSLAGWSPPRAAAQAVEAGADMAMIPASAWPAAKRWRRRSPPGRCRSAPSMRMCRACCTPKASPPAPRWPYQPSRRGTGSPAPEGASPPSGSRTRDPFPVSG